MRGLDPTFKANRVANYFVSLRHELLALCRACGVVHPGLITSAHLEFLTEDFRTATPMEMFEYKSDWGLPSEVDQAEIRATMEALATRPVDVRGVIPVDAVPAD